MTEYFLRIQEYDNYFDTLVKWFSSPVYDRVLLVHHSGKVKENPHFHAVFTTSLSEDEIRKEISTRFQLGKGNKHHTLKVSDGNIKVKSYLLHEDTPFEYVKGFTQEELSEFEQKNLQVKKDIKEKPRDKLKDRVLQKMIDTYLVGDGFHSWDQLAVKKLIFDLIYEDCETRDDYLPNKFCMERIINYVQMRFTAKKYGRTEIHRDFLYNEMFPSRF